MEDQLTAQVRNAGNGSLFEMDRQRCSENKKPTGAGLEDLAFLDRAADPEKGSRFLSQSVHLVMVKMARGY
jgi:hypothetical protein